MDLGQLKAALFDSVQRSVKADGFVMKAAKDSFIRRQDGIADIFQLVCLDGKPGWRIQPNVAVRIDHVEDIFHQTSRFEPKYQNDTPTIGGAVGNILTGDNRGSEFFVESAEDIPKATEGLVRVFHDFALPYFQKFGSLHAIDAELNDNPTTRTPHRVAPWLRCSTGLIVAKLVGRPNYDELVQIYSGIMTNTDKGFYLKRFQQLVESLKSIPSRSGELH